MKTQDVFNVSGLSHRQVHHAITKGWLKPIRVEGVGQGGMVYEWSQEEYNIAIVAGRLYRNGFRIESAMQLARRTYESKQDRLYLGEGIDVYISKR